MKNFLRPQVTLSEPLLNYETTAICLNICIESPQNQWHITLKFLVFVETIVGEVPKLCRRKAGVVLIAVVVVEIAGIRHHA